MVESRSFQADGPGISLILYGSTRVNGRPLANTEATPSEYNTKQTVNTIYQTNGGLILVNRVN